MMLDVNVTGGGHTGQAGAMVFTWNFKSFIVI